MNGYPKSLVTFRLIGMLFWCLILHQKGPEGPAMSAPRNRERAPTGHRASNCLLSTNEMTHFGNDRGFIVYYWRRQRMWWLQCCLCRYGSPKYTVSSVIYSHLSSNWSIILTLNFGIKRARKPVRVCPLKQGTVADGSPGLKLPKVNQWNDAFWKWLRICDQMRQRHNWVGQK